ncbi:uncharacterized protein PV07_01454 [Cladophialophora immunda]|uniref:Phytocyanin domain-containing protein n=1 Tax=Cladophialophora immunda TaxID=569365 RepID=A0A0D2CXR4_9EURO|nr:uncharacterized protein PV07_01454 [Cladophialophora immunda]KIW34690.1 hypothetical protein PV07_01454 [Cladophialophora immunda]OQU98765.1 hypothetical protein CLAIMM_04496 isoform 1 [Cladophialophora immunda]OQU98766.1 hypothetical protein CLAIMM_04496 isoform 2 [Cladophialophora immunda]
MRSYTLLSLGALASAATFDVNVGQNGFTYSPDTVKAAVGDTVNFHFYPGDHTVTQSPFDSPCQPVSGNAINSGVINSNSGQASTMFSMRVNSTDPLWLYCGQVGHCAAGMAMVINPPSNGNTLAAYQKAASGQSGQIPSSVFGGVIVANVDNAGASSNASSSSSGSSSSSSASGSSSATNSATTTATTTTAAASTTNTAASAQSTSNAASSSFGVMTLEWSLVGTLLAPAVAYLFS